MWLGGCSGCHMSFLDLDERLIPLASLADVCYSPIADVKEFPEAVDIVLVEGAIATALGEAERRRITGPAVTPFVLKRLSDLTSGQTVIANRALLVNNALWAARFAKALKQQA